MAQGDGRFDGRFDGAEMGETGAVGEEERQRKMRRKEKRKEKRRRRREAERAREEEEEEEKRARAKSAEGGNGGGVSRIKQEMLRRKEEEKKKKAVPLTDDRLPPSSVHRLRRYTGPMGKQAHLHHDTIVLPGQGRPGDKEHEWKHIKLADIQRIEDTVDPKQHRMLLIMTVLIALPFNTFAVVSASFFGDDSISVFIGIIAVVRAFGGPWIFLQLALLLRFAMARRGVALDRCALAFNRRCVTMGLFCFAVGLPVAACTVGVFIGFDPERVLQWATEYDARNQTSGGLWRTLLLLFVAPVVVFFTAVGSFLGGMRTLPVYVSRREAIEKRRE
jgi:hypothetical protein